MSRQMLYNAAAQQAANSVGYLAELEAVRAYASGQAYTEVSSTYLNALNTLIASLKTGGIWTKLDILQVYANGNEDWAGINIINPIVAHQGANNGTTFTAAQGFTGDGSTTWYDTNFNATTEATNYLLNDASKGIWVRTAATVGSRLMGVVGNGGQAMLGSNSVGQIINAGTTTLNSAASLIGTGLMSIHRDDATNVRVYNNTTENARTQTSSVIYNGNFVTHRSNTNYSNAQIAMFFAGAALTSGENTAFVNAFTAYLAAV